MAPRRVIDFLRWAEAYHGRLAEFYLACEREAARPDLKALLAYMARHQDALRRVIDEYERGGSRAVLESWYKISPTLDTTRDFSDAKFRSDMTPAEAVDMALELDRTLLSMYDELIRRAESETLRQVLANLLQAERREEIQLMRSQLPA